MPVMLDAQQEEVFYYWIHEVAVIDALVRDKGPGLAELRDGGGASAG